MVAATRDCHAEQEEVWPIVAPNSATGRLAPCQEADTERKAFSSKRLAAIVGVELLST